MLSPRIDCCFGTSCRDELVRVLIVRTETLCRSSVIRAKKLRRWIETLRAESFVDVHFDAPNERTPIPWKSAVLCAIAPCLEGLFEHSVDEFAKPELNWGRWGKGRLVVIAILQWTCEKGQKISRQAVLGDDVRLWPYRNSHWPLIAARWEGWPPTASSHHASSPSRY